MLNQQQAQQQAAAQQAQQQAAAQQAAYSQQALAQQAAPQRDPFVASQGVPVAASPQPSTPYHSKGSGPCPRAPPCWPLLTWTGCILSLEHAAICPRADHYLLAGWMARGAAKIVCWDPAWQGWLSSETLNPRVPCPQIRAWCAGRSCGTGTWRRVATRWAASHASSAWRASAGRVPSALRPPPACCTHALSRRRRRPERRRRGRLWCSRGPGPAR
jgi:type II secretory pathway pseudopilin PulG